MSNGLISLFIAAGAAGWAYSKLGRRVGYGNSKSVWQIVAVAFVLVFLVLFTLLKYIIHLN